MLSYITAGESHGKYVLAIVEGFPAGITISPHKIRQELDRRRLCAGRGPRMKRESDRFEIISGLRKGKSIGSPITILINNKAYTIEEKPPLTQVRPGHADLSGALKFGLKDARNIAERSSARETAARVAAGALAKILLDHFNIEVLGYVTEIAGIQARLPQELILSPARLHRQRIKSPFYLLDKSTEKKVQSVLKQAQDNGNSLGGAFEVIAFNTPVGLGSHTQWTSRLDGRLARAVMSIPAVKSVEIGLGIGYRNRSGREVHDIVRTRRGQAVLNQGLGFARLTNNAGGIEGGISNGENIIVRAAVKPVPTLTKPLQSIDLRTGRNCLAQVESTDLCIVPAASVIGETVVAFELAQAFLEKFGGDTLTEIKHNFHAYQKQLRKLYKNASR